MSYRGVHSTQHPAVGESAGSELHNFLAVSLASFLASTPTQVCGAVANITEKQQSYVFVRSCLS